MYVIRLQICKTFLHTSVGFTMNVSLCVGSWKQCARRTVTLQGKNVQQTMTSEVLLLRITDHPSLSTTELLKRLLLGKGVDLGVISVRNENTI